MAITIDSIKAANTVSVEVIITNPAFNRFRRWLGANLIVAGLRLMGIGKVEVISGDY